MDESQIREFRGRLSEFEVRSVVRTLELEESEPDTSSTDLKKFPKKVFRVQVSSLKLTKQT